ncbi:MAG: hypothetical protein AABX72_02490 [Nanoarchaeota archaeon]
MSSVRSALRQVKRQLLLNRIFNVFLNAALLSTICAVILAFVKVSWYFALIPGILYFIPATIKNVKQIKLREAEEKIPELQWQLRTTEDTLGKENEVIESLHYRVMQILTRLKTSYLVDGKILGYKAGAVVALLGLFLLFSTQSFLTDMISPNGLTGLFAKDPGDLAFNDVNGSSLKSKYGDRDIYGEKDLAELGNEALDLELKRQNNDLNYDDVNDPQNRQFTSKGSLGDIGASADASYEEEIDEEHQQLVKNYFEKLAED